MEVIAYHFVALHTRVWRVCMCVAHSTAQSNRNGNTFYCAQILIQTINTYAIITMPSIWCRKNVYIFHVCVCVCVIPRPWMCWKFGMNMNNDTNGN